MPECEKCKYAIWDYEDYYPSGWQWFITGCKIANDEKDCTDYEENEE